MLYRLSFLSVAVLLSLSLHSMKEEGRVPSLKKLAWDVVEKDPSSAGTTLTPDIVRYGCFVLSDKVWKQGTPVELDPKGFVLSMGWDGDSHLITRSRHTAPCSIKRWDLKSGIGEEIAKDEGEVMVLHLPGDEDDQQGHVLVFSDFSNPITLWEGKDKKRVINLSYEPDEETPCMIALTPDKACLATVHTVEEKIKIWDAVTGMKKATLKNDARETFTSLAWSPDGMCLAAGTACGAIRVFDVKEEREINRWQVGDKDLIGAVGWSPDGQYMGVGLQKGIIKICDVKSGEVKWRSKGPEFRISSLVWSPNGKLLATAGFDDKVCVTPAPDALERLSLAQLILLKDKKFDHALLKDFPDEFKKLA